MAFLPPPPYKIPTKADHKVGKKGKPSGPRFLVTVSVLGSAGPIRVVVTEGDTVAAVITSVLRAYAREGRLPALGGNRRAAAADFLLYTAGSEALSPGAAISSKGSRAFILCRRDNALPIEPGAVAVGNKPTSSPPVRKDAGGAGWKSWINKSLTFKISSH